MENEVPGGHAQKLFTYASDRCYKAKKSGGGWRIYNKLSKEDTIKQRLKG